MSKEEERIERDRQQVAEYVGPITKLPAASLGERTSETSPPWGKARWKVDGRDLGYQER